MDKATVIRKMLKHGKSGLLVKNYFISCVQLLRHQIELEKQKLELMPTRCNVEIILYYDQVAHIQAQLSKMESYLDTIESLDLIMGA